MNSGATPQPQSAAPANAPTGPRNAGKPGANYRGGGRGGHRGFHPYSRWWRSSLCGWLIRFQFWCFVLFCLVLDTSISLYFFKLLSIYSSSIHFSLLSIYLPIRPQKLWLFFFLSFFLVIPTLVFYDFRFDDWGCGFDFYYLPFLFYCFSFFLFPWFPFFRETWFLVDFDGMKWDGMGLLVVVSIVSRVNESTLLVRFMILRSCSTHVHQSKGLLWWTCPFRLVWVVHISSYSTAFSKRCRVGQLLAQKSMWTP